MPRATYNPQDTRRFELKSLPGAFVELRSLDFGKQIWRQQLQSAMKMTSDSGSGFMGQMDLTNKDAVFFEFEHCVVDHNLEDDKGNKLNFKKSSDVEALHPRIGDEVRGYIREMNDFEQELEDPSLETSSGQSLQETSGQQSLV